MLSGEITQKIAIIIIINYFNVKVLKTCCHVDIFSLHPYSENLSVQIVILDA